MVLSSRTRLHEQEAGLCAMTAKSVTFRGQRSRLRQVNESLTLRHGYSSVNSVSDKRGDERDEICRRSEKRDGNSYKRGSVIR